MKTSTCWKCHQPIWFGETERGKTIPINTWSSPTGKIVAIDPDADKPMVRWLKKDEAEPGPEVRRYHSHIGTCRPKRKAA